MRKFLVLIPVFFVFGCATTPSSEYAQVTDHKYNTVRYISKDANSNDAFVGTSATQPRSTFPRLHP